MKPYTKTIHVHGYISMLLFFTAIALAVIILFQSDFILGLGYTIIVFVGILLISLTYCRKCVIRNNCNHLLPGLISRILPFKDEDYNTLDIVFTLIPVLLIIAIPQYWLISNILLFAVFWILLGLAGLEINRYVCKGCGNKKCMMCKEC